MTDGWQRCFIALAPDAATRDALAAVPVAPTARRVPYEQLHLTVTFIGALPAAHGEALGHELAARAVPMSPARIERVEHWPNANRPRLTVATLAMSDEFVALDWRIRSLMLELGLPVDARAFRPHITLARFGRDAAPVGDVRMAAPEVAARFESLVLYSSTLARHGARYSALASVPLA
ncbi:RNA 2',3'-cyclic phosphodiesterase [Paraburkholderia saeva]|uniref:RNA 2',3'-cyclic phosphodiesterase n=1 Tax=Paraburkholderia saeva TaxID=2777537 RepID=A0A9N8X3Z6_9BURK|nr:RNA 2',3'-cyclic phosphodiesterase [Paraburkholderia saeva]CAG4918468.1 RNA 2',3'-cyclic phosphodiesterase [Paraburkholderia saeva]CAG4919778.1 RNA 2',3'-cyclic phosphodiesterase [Paraburkholderia saeva]